MQYLKQSVTSPRLVVYTLGWNWSKAGDISLWVQQAGSIIAGSLEAAYSLNWGAREIWGKGGGETLALLW